MDTKKIPIEADTVRERDNLVPLGPKRLELPDGDAIGYDANEAMVITIEHETKGKLLVLVAAAEINGERIATMTQFTAAQARNYAASILQGANQIDGGGVVN